jgi:pimeloyl-ACP methyl ester carboxylesterase
MYLTPSSRLRQTAIVIASGTGSEFYEYTEWAEAFVAAGYPVVVLNRRDHGGDFGYEPFEASALDIRYAIDFAVRHGAVDVVLVGHSYGTVGDRSPLVGEAWIVVAPATRPEWRRHRL